MCPEWELNPQTTDSKPVRFSYFTYLGVYSLKTKFNLSAVLQFSINKSKFYNIEVLLEYDPRTSPYKGVVLPIKTIEPK